MITGKDRTGGPAARRAARLLLAAVLLWPAAAWPQAAGQDAPEPGELVNFAYSAILGTGYYRVGERSIYAFRIPLAWRVREPRLRDDGTAAPGKSWVLPISIGLIDFSPDLEEGLPSIDNVAAVTLLPGVEFDWDRPSGWKVRTNFNFGASFDLESDERAGVMELTARGTYELRPMRSDSIGLTYGHRLTSTAYKPENRSRNSLGYFSLGLDARWLQNWQILDRTAVLGAVIYGDFFYRSAGFAIPEESLEEIDRVFTVGISVGAARDFEVLGIGFDRVGLGYRFGPGVRALTLFTDFPF